tara:strand:+ start:1621 stop:1962 length:342 start_codon:yes stop_codon:yes gene_type:complete
MKRIFIVFFILIVVASCGLFSSKSTDITVELLNKTQNIPIGVILSEGQNVYKQKICVEGFSSSRILINGTYTLKNNIDTCFIGDWYSPTDTLRIEPLDKAVSGVLSFRYYFYY